MSRILHAALPDDWSAAVRAGSYAVSSRGRTLAEEGFIHASTRAQLPGVLDGFYGDLSTAAAARARRRRAGAAGSPVRWDDVPGQPAPFPHIYGPVPTSVVGQGNPVVAVLLTGSPRRRGTWRLPDLSAYDLAVGP